MEFLVLTIKKYFAFLLAFLRLHLQTVQMPSVQEHKSFLLLYGRQTYFFFVSAFLNQNYFYFFAGYHTKWVTANIYWPFNGL